MFGKKKTTVTRQTHLFQQDEFVCGALAVGWPDTPDALPPRAPLPRTGNPVIWIG